MRYFRTGEFAKKAGVTLRTLRYYDKMELLKPSAYSESGQRLYSEKDFVRLHQILALKRIGLPLDEIKILLSADSIELLQILELQKRVLQEKVRQLSTVIQAIEKVQLVENLNWQQIIKVINMQTDWFTHFFTDEQIQKLVQKPLAEQKAIGEAWKALFNDIAQAMQKEYADVQPLVIRWNALVEHLTEGDLDLAANLNNAYASIGELPEVPQEIQVWVQELQIASMFVQKSS